MLVEVDDSVTIEERWKTYQKLKIDVRETEARWREKMLFPKKSETTSSKKAAMKAAKTRNKKYQEKLHGKDKP